MANKIIRYRTVQTTTLEDFINEVTKNSICKYCTYYNDCVDLMGEENMEYINGQGCTAFDNSIDNIKQFFLKEKTINKT